MKRKCKAFLGHPMTRADQSAIASLVGYTTMPLGLPKKRIKSEEQLWTITERMFGLRPLDGEEFVQSVRRIRNAIKRIPAEERSEARRRCMETYGVVIPMVPEGRQPRPPRPPRLPKEVKTATTSVKKRDDFYLSWEWRRLRMKVIKQYDRRCMCCGATPDDITVGGTKVRLVVDHIKPISKHWGLRLDVTNLQILCDECNMGKGAWDETDHRSESERLIAQQLHYDIGAAA